MEAQELRIARLEDIMEMVVSNQTQILRNQQEHTARLEEHSQRLDNLERLMTRMVEELVAIKEILASSRGMGFAPEPDDGE